MKKFLSLCIVFLILLGCYFNSKKTDFYLAFKHLKNCSFSYVLSSKNYIELTKNTQNLLIGSKSLKNGTKTMLYYNGYLNDNFLNYVEYSQVCFNGSKKNVDKILKSFNIKIVKTEKLEQKEILYGYSSFWKNYKLLGDNKINFQFVIDGEKITIGYPLIYNSF